MDMVLSARHTKILEQITTPFGTLVREDYFGYPETESNIYLVDFTGHAIWHAERAMEKDAFSNPIHHLTETCFKCSSWNGFDCEIDLETGKLIHAAFTR
jgi:hypothetical protein